jgi:hypothetical protein
MLIMIVTQSTKRINDKKNICFSHDLEDQVSMMLANEKGSK